MMNSEDSSRIEMKNTTARTGMSISNGTTPSKGSISRSNTLIGDINTLPKARDSLPKKATEFYLHIQVLKAKQLMVESNLNTACKVLVAGHVKCTQVQTSTREPSYEESFYLSMVKLPDEMWATDVEFRVCNTKLLRAKQLIGRATVNLGNVYDQPEHAIIGRWLPLLNAQEEFIGEAAGFLKVSVALLGPQDKSPSMDHTASSESENEASINFYSTAGFRLATLVVDIFGGEVVRFVPGKLSGKFFPARPYIEVDFAGVTNATEAINANADLEFNQRLHIPFYHPPLTNFINIRLLNWSKFGNSSMIAMYKIPLDQISRAGDDAFLPTFGPAFVNFYGALNIVNFMELNRAKRINRCLMEGCAYRGRVLLSINTVLGEPKLNPSESIAPKVSPKVMTDRYILICMIESIGLLNKHYNEIEFEISMGVTCDMAETEGMGGRSTTQPMTSMSDGEKYFFVPLGNERPCMIIETNCENVECRVSTCNALSCIYLSIEQTMKSLVAAKKARETFESASRLLSIMTENILSALSGALACFQSNATELDIQLRVLRKTRLCKLKRLVINVSSEATTYKTALDACKSCLLCIRDTVADPQISVPDIFLWMLINRERVAYARIKASDVMYTKLSDKHVYKGISCRQTQTLHIYPPGLQDDMQHVVAQVRAKLWLGQQENYYDWYDNLKDGRMSFYAEAFEDQVLPSCQRSPRTLTKLSRTAWSNDYGNHTVPIHAIEAPCGWKFCDEWHADQGPCLLKSDETGHALELEKIFEAQFRKPGGKWQHSLNLYTDYNGVPMEHLEDMTVPSGWQWEGDWQQDLNDAVDKDGWEYTTSADTSYTDAAENWHLRRRRRWLRARRPKTSHRRVTFSSTNASDEPIHSRGPNGDRSMHTSILNSSGRRRRRRWRRELVGVANTVFKLPTLTLNEHEKLSQPSSVALNVYVHHANCFKFQLRAHIYQARQLHSGDRSGLSDPYVVVNFLHHTKRTKHIQATLCPTWNTTIIFDDVTIYGHPLEAITNPPPVNVEVFDHNLFRHPDLLGRSHIPPVGHIDPEISCRPKLQWHMLYHDGEQKGEMLAAFELYCKCGKLPLYSGIRPAVRRTAVEIVCWGLRGMKKTMKMNVFRPFIELQCSGNIVTSGVIKHMKHFPNFDDPFLFMDLMLPTDPSFSPPLVLKVRDHLYCGAKPILGTHVIKSLAKYLVRPTYETKVIGTSFIKNSRTSQETKSKTSAVDVIESQESIIGTKQFDWWSKYYASHPLLDGNNEYIECGYETLRIYGTELEKVPRFNGLQGVLRSFGLHRGKSNDQKENCIGYIKAALSVYSLPADPKADLPPKQIHALPIAGVEELVVRVYIVRCYDLAAKDLGGMSDPFLKIKLGSNQMTTRDNYKAKTLNPIFGALAEFLCKIPAENQLEVSVMDFDLTSKDDLIGSTYIDIENRYFSKNRATCGLPLIYHTYGPNRWRDVKKPSEILDDFCQVNSHSEPDWIAENTVVINNKRYTFAGKGGENSIRPASVGCVKEQVALFALHSLGAVPEHVETRQLFNPAMPGTEQGRIELFVDIFPVNQGVPEHVVDISPRCANKYELRIKLYNVADVIMSEFSKIAGSSMSDVYVKCWLKGVKKKQQTDVHFRCMDGEAMFNWLFVFNIDYIEAERVMVVRGKKQIWTGRESEQRLPPILMFQVWDDDIIGKDDFLGEIELNLSELPHPAKNATECGLHQLNLKENNKTDNQLSNHTNSQIKTKISSEKSGPSKSQLCSESSRGKSAINVDSTFSCDMSEPSDHQKSSIAGQEREESTNQLATENNLWGHLTGAFLKKKKPVENETPIDLWQKRRIRGFWPVLGQKEGVRDCIGKLDMEMELLSEVDAKNSPVAKLEPPDRPGSSFLWFRSPWKTFKYIIWKRHKFLILTVLIILPFAMFGILMVYSMPQVIANRFARIL